MSLDKAIEHGKEKRKQYYGAKTDNERATNQIEAFNEFGTVL